MEREQQIFLDAIAKPVGQRRSYLDGVCGDDLALRRRLELLLKSHQEAGNFLHNDPLDGPSATASVDFPPQGRAAESAQQGDTIGRYKLLEGIGEGGFGVVYMAEQRQPISRRVALKIIKLGMDTRQVIARFEAERQALAMMDHPNIAKVLDAGATTSGRPFFVMELVRGRPITKFCDEHQLTTRERLQLFTAVCHGIQHAHQKGVIHRDIKPNNVIVTWHDDQAVPKVIDFGVAKATEHRLTEKTVFTRYAEMIGTPTYMSPEQARLGTDVDTRSDIYSLGVLLYELLSGAPPFDTEQLLTAGYDEMRRRICDEEPPTPSARLSSLSAVERNSVAKNRKTEVSRLNRLFYGELDWIVMKAMEKDRRRRYETASTLADDVRRYLAGEAVSAAAPSVVYRARKFVLRNKQLVATMTAICASLCLGIVLSVWQGVRAVRQAARAEASELVTRRNLYVSEMATAQREFNDFNTKRTIELLRNQIPQPHEEDFRGFEWRWLWDQCHQEEFQLVGHTRLLRDLKFSPDGKWVASASRDGTARLWDVESRREVWQHAGGLDCNRVDFSSDGRFLATHFFGETAGQPMILWDLSKPSSPVERPLKDYAPTDHVDLLGITLRRLSKKNLSAGQAFSSDGRTFAMLETGVDGNGGIWDVPTGERLFTFPPHRGYADTPVKGVAISPVDPDLIATCSPAGTRIWKRDGTLVRQLLQQDAKKQSMVSFSSDGKRLAIRQYFGAIRVFDTNSWQEVATIRPPAAGNTVAFSPLRNDLLLAGGDDGTIRGWTIASDHSTLNHPNAVVAVEFSPDGTVLAVCLDTGAVWFWEVAARSRRFETPKQGSLYDTLLFQSGYSGDFAAFSPEGTQVAIIGPENVITVWNTKTGKPIHSVQHPNGRKYSSVLFSPQGDRLFAGSLEAADSGVHVWSLASPEPAFLRKLPHPGYGVKSLAVFDSVLVSGNEKNVKYWDREKLALRSTLQLPPHPFNGALSLDFGGTSSNLAIGDGYWGALLWNGESFSVLPHKNAVAHVSFSPKKRLASADVDDTVKLWDTEAKQAIATFSGRTAEFSRDGNLLAIGAQGHAWLPDHPDNGKVVLLEAPPLKLIDEAIAGKQ